MKIEDLVRPNILALKPYTSARDEYHKTEKKAIFLDANENPYGRFNRYPDPYQKKVKQAIAKLKGLPEDHIFLGNGSDEVLDAILRVFCEPKRDGVLIFPPTYGMYEVLANIQDVPLHKIPLNEKFHIPLEETLQYLREHSIKLIILCSPNNPTGNLLNNKDIEVILNEFQGVLVVDEAYIDFAKEPSWLTRLKDFPNLIVSQTLSKAWGGAALRIGMAFANPSIVHFLNKVKYPYNISEANQSEVLKKLSAPFNFRKNIDKILRNRSMFIHGLENNSYIEKIYPTDANFVLIKVPDANALYEYLMQHGIVIRNRHSQVPNTLRITIGKETEVQKILRVMKNYTQELVI